MGDEPGEAARLERLVGDMRRATSELTARLEHAERAERALSEELQATGRAHELFASLYVELERLHRSLKLGDVVAAVHEALINLVGSEDFALFVRDEGSGRFRRLSGMGSGLAAADFAAGEGRLGEAVQGRLVRWGDPPAAAPLVDGAGRCVGLIAVLGLLQHKRELERRDRTLIEVLAAHAGVALEAALCAAAGPPSWNVERLRALLGGPR